MGREHHCPDDRHHQQGGHPDRDGIELGREVPHDEPTPGHEAGRGGGDRFRIKIWDALTGEVFYDSQPSDPEGADPTAAVNGGSIVIHDR